MYWFENRHILTESVDRSSVIKALKGRNRVKINYVSNVPDYGVAEGDRFAVVLALGKGRYPYDNPDDVIRIYQWYGDSYGRKYNKSYKILYLKDITEFEILPIKEKDPGRLFNPDDDRWMSSVEMIADFSKFGYGKGKVRTDADYEAHNQPQNMETDKLIKIEHQYKVAKGLTNRALSLYNKARRGGVQAEINATLQTFRDSQSVTNRLMAIYKKLQKQSNEIDTSKTKTEQELENNQQ